MSRATDTPSPEPSSALRAGSTLPSGKIVCPFCGSINERPSHDYDNTACPRCTMADTPATRQATRARLGPWFVRQQRNPAAPGMRFDTLMALVKRGQVTAQSVVRGPTTNQFWRFAAQVKGLSREFGVCYNCATPVEKTATICPSCNRMQEPPANPDVLLENAPTAAAATAPVTPPAPAPVPMPTVTAPVHREIKTPAPTPAPAPAAAPAFAPAAAAAATVEKPAFAPQRSTSPRRERDREPAPMRRDEASPRTDLLAPPHRQRALPKQRTADDGILSARDLATAFQLDFKPDTHRGGTFKRIALVGVLLGVSGVAIAAIVSPGFRDNARMWFADKATALRGAVTGRPATPTAPPKQSPVASGSPTPKVAASLAPATRPAGPSPEELYPLPPLPKQPEPTEAIAAKPETQPASQEKPAQAAAPTTPAPAAPAPAQITIAPVPSAPRGAEPTTRPAQQAKDTTREPAKDQPVAKVAAAPVDAAKAREQALSLWRQALDAEARRDYAKAVEHYEAIQKLPKSTWPAGLEINLKYAKSRVK